MRVINHSVIEIIEENVPRIVNEEEVIVDRAFRHIHPCVKVDGAWQDTDISSEDEDVQALCNATWTEEAKQAYKDHIDSNYVEPQPE